MPIELDRKDGEYGCINILQKNSQGRYEYVCKRDTKKYRITKKNYLQSDLFEKYVHSEITPTKTTFLYFVSKKLGISTQNFSFSDNNDLNSVEIYFPKLGTTNVPLVIVIKTNVPYCYEFSYLKSLNRGTRISNRSRFKEDELLDYLIKENNNLNQVITYRLEKPNNDNYDGVTLIEPKDHPSFETYKHTPLEEFEGRSGYVLFKGKKLTLTEQSSYKGRPKLTEIQKRCYNEIIVWYFKFSNTHKTNPPKYLELKEKKEQDPDNQSNIYYLERTDYIGLNWKQINNPKLDEIITFLLDKTPSISEKYNDDSIEVTKSSNESFEFYTQKPESSYKTKKGILRFNDEDLALEPNDLIHPEKKFNEFDGKTYCSVSLFYFNDSTQNKKPAFLELIKKGTCSGTGSEVGQPNCTTDSKCYLFQRADDFGTRWKQIGYQDLRKTVTYQLEFKNESGTGKYNGDSVNVTETEENSFDVYTHTATKPDNLGLFLYQWHTLTLQPNDSFTDGKIDKLHGKKYCKLVTYYSQTYRDQPPFYLELFEGSQSDSTCQSLESGASNSTWLQRVDPNAHHWMQKNKGVGDLGPQKARDLIDEIKNHDKNSIIVQLNDKGWYDMKIIKHYRSDGIGKLTTPSKTVYATYKALSNFNYQYYAHDLSVLDDHRTLNIERVRTFIGNIEVKMYNMEGKEADLSYPPKQGTSKTLDVYFYVRDNFPLMINYSESWYKSNKSDYLVKWTYTSGRTFTDPNSLKAELDKINKIFNEILLDQTSKNGYGISSPPSGKTPSGFDTKRITVKPEKIKDKFGKVTHSTKNGSSIGTVMLGGEELKDESGKKLSEALSAEKGLIFVGVTAYYHKTDSGYEKPLLLGFIKTGSGRNIGDLEVFYERQNCDDTSTWKKISGSAELRPLKGGNLEETAKRIDTIHYNIGKSVKIQVDQQAHGSSGNSYQVKLVPNTNGGGGPQQVSGEPTITVTKNCSDNPSLINYTCYKHQIPSNIDSTNHYVSGLRLYVCDKYLETHTGFAKLPIHYDSAHKEVKMYFYGTSGTSTNPDKVPLLAENNGTHYRPRSRDEYFEKWIEVKVSQNGDERGDSISGKPLQEVLDGINKDLNTLELDKTGGSGTESYGIKHPESPTSTCPNGTGIPLNEFCKRVTVRRETGQSIYYLKVIHKTVNKGPIGPFKYREQTISGIKTDEKEILTCNQVHVYYLASDVNYESPLLICIISEGSGPISCTSKWYSRTGIDINSWNSADNNDGKFTGDSNIQKELEKIQVNLSNYLFLEIDRHTSYSPNVQKGSQSGKKENIGSISALLDYGHSEYKPENYRFCKHQLYNYYTENKNHIKTKLELNSQNEDPTLQVSIYIDSIYINILGTNNQTLSTPLTYGQTQESGGTHYDPYVYFYEPETYTTGHGTDTVPLLFKYGDRFYGPLNKEDYFKKWKQVNITDSGDKVTQNIKKHLDRINGELNEVNLSKKGDRDEQEYGIPDPGGGVLNGPFKTTRIKVEQNSTQVTRTGTSSSYTTISHITSNGFNIGNIKDLSSTCKFDNQHTEQLGETQRHNEAVAVYTGVGITSLGNQTPQLVLVAESKGKGSLGSGTSTVHGYYDLTNEAEGRCSSPHMFKKVKTGFDLNDLTNKGKMTEEQLVKILTKLGIVKDEVKATPPPLSTEPALTESVGSRGDGNEDRSHTDVDEGQDDRPKVGLGAHGLAGSGGVDSGAKAQEGPPGDKGETGETGEQGDLGIKGNKGGPDQEQHVEQQQQESQVPKVNNGREEQQQSHGDAVDGGGHGGGAGQGPLGENGKPGSPQGQQADTGSSTGVEEVFKQVLQYAKDKPEIVGGTGGGVGVGVIATVGGVLLF